MQGYLKTAMNVEMNGNCMDNDQYLILYFRKTSDLNRQIKGKENQACTEIPGVFFSTFIHYMLQISITMKLNEIQSCVGCQVI